MTLIRIVGYNLPEEPTKRIWGPWPYTLKEIHLSGLIIPNELVIPFGKPRIIETLDYEKRGSPEIYRAVLATIPDKDEKYAGAISRVNAFESGEDWLHLVSKREIEEERESRRGMAIKLYIINNTSLIKRIYEMQNGMREESTSIP